MIHLGDLFDVLPTLAEASVDACVTDPPYGLGFMGKQWDTFKPGEAEKRIVVNAEIASDNPNLRGRTRGPASSPSAVEYDRSLRGQIGFEQWTEQWAREVFRVLKPGAHMLVCGAPRSYHRMASGLEDAGFEIRDCLCWLFGQGFPKSLNFANGLGTALKPAHEPIVLCRKPCEGSTTKNVLTHGTGALRIDDCRIDTSEETGRANRIGPYTSERTWSVSKTPGQNATGRGLGRWPSNVLLDEIAAASLDEMSGELVSGGTPEFRASDKFRNTYGTFKGGESEEGIGSSTGGASRFFYVAKPSRSERDRGTHHLEPQPRDDSRKEGNPGGDNPRNRGLQRRGNHHPTVKPIELMRYLVRLITPKGGTVIDPFTGSGTTGMACRYEGVNFIGIEREAEYVAIAERRIADCLPLFGEASA